MIIYKIIIIKINNNLFEIIVLLNPESNLSPMLNYLFISLFLISILYID